MYTIYNKLKFLYSGQIMDEKEGKLVKKKKKIQPPKLLMGENIQSYVRISIPADTTLPHDINDWFNKFRAEKGVRVCSEMRIR